LLQNDLKFLKIILKSFFVSVSNLSALPNETLTPLATEHTSILLKSLRLYLQRLYFNSKLQEKYKNFYSDLIKIFASLIKSFKKSREILDNIDLSKYGDINDFLHKIFFIEIISDSKHINETIDHSSSEEEDKNIIAKEELNRDTDIEKIKIKFIDIILDYYFELSKTFSSSIYLINHGVPLEIIFLILKFEKENSNVNLQHTKLTTNEISKKCFKIFKKLLNLSQEFKDDLQIKQITRNSCRDFFEMILNIFQKQFFNDFISILERDNCLSHHETENEIINILVKLKSNLENPEFIWNEDLRTELVTKIYQILDKLNSGIPVEYLKELKSFKYQSFSDELKIGGVYIKIFNREPHWILANIEVFMEELKEAFLQTDDLDNLSEIMNAISNTINNLKANEFIVLSDEHFVEKFYCILKVNKLDLNEKADRLRKKSDLFSLTTQRESSKEFSKEISVRKTSENSFSNNKNQPVSNPASILLNKLIPAGLNFLQTISFKSNCLSVIISSSTFFILIKILEACNTKECIDPILKILRNVSKNQEYVDKINLSMFLFFLKKIIFLKDAITKANKDSVNGLRVDILKIIKRYIFSEKVGFAIKGLFEFYLPLKIIDNIFSGKDVTEQNLTWIDSELELPDLIWNYDAMSQSKKLLEEDINFIIDDEQNFENFPHNLFSHKLNPLRNFFFEITDEFRIDNLYLRIFNKDPSYNIRKNLIIFLKHVLVCQINTFKEYTILNFYFDNLNTKMYLRIAELLKQKFVTCLTAICLIIEQINFNDFNDNLAISSTDEMKIVIKDDVEKNLINLIQRSFEYQKLLSVAMISKILSVSKFLFGIETNFYNSFLHFDNNIRLVYLQIVYLISLNKNGINLISDNFDVITILEKMHNNQDKIGDCNLII